MQIVLFSSKKSTYFLKGPNITEIFQDVRHFVAASTVFFV